MTPNLKKLSPFTYLALVLLVFSNITRYLLMDTNLGSRFKNFNRELTASDILLAVALLMYIVGVVWKVFKHHKKARMQNTSITLSFVLILPLSIVLVVAPLLETFMPDGPGDNLFSSLFSIFAIIATFSSFAWAIHLLATVVKQLYFILTYKDQE